MAFQYPRLSTQDVLGEKGKAFFQCVIVGSGFGGSVMAARLSEHFGPGKLAVLERGKEYQPGDFTTNFGGVVKALKSPLQPLGMYDFAFGSDMDSLVGNALGGTSNLYANVILEPYPEVFNTCMDPSNPSQSRCWPRAITHDALKPYFNRVRGVMGVEKHRDSDDHQAGIPTHDPHLEGSPAYGAETGTDLVTGRILKDYRGRAVAQRPPLAKAKVLQETLANIQKIDESPQPSSGALDPNERDHKSTVKQAWTQLRNGMFQDQFATEGTFDKAPIAVNLSLIEDGERNAAGVPQWKCRLCGDCVTGCNIGAKNTMIMNYLPMAKRKGASIYTQVEVLSIAASDRADYRYQLHVLCREEIQGQLYERDVIVYTNMLVLSAGVLGTVKLLLTAQARDEFRFSAQLGKRFSGNADAIAISYNGKQRLDSIGYGQEETDWDVGPTITAMADFRRVPGRRHLIEDAAFPSALVHSSGRLFGTSNLWKANRKIWIDLTGKTLAEKVTGALNHSQIWLAMGHDSAGGELSLDRAGNLRLRWAGAGAQQVYDATQRTFDKLAKAIGASNISNPRAVGRFLNRKRPTPVTVHPLGGCCMADDIGHGVVDHAGRVYHPNGGVYPGLYISDGSVCDASVGANPSLTIAAIAERSAEQIIRDDLPGVLRRQETPAEANLPRAKGANQRQAQTNGANAVADQNSGLPITRQPRESLSPLAFVLLMLLLVLLLMRAFFEPQSTQAMGNLAAVPSFSQPAERSEVVAGLQLHWLDVRSIKADAPGEMRVGILAPPSGVEPQADIVFMHGHADRLDNHGVLFSRWRDAGFRVISFDLPSHGESNILPIDLYTLADFAGLVRLVEAATLDDPERPLFLAGWSFGGLITARIAQEPALVSGLSRTPDAILLLAPAVAPYPFAGGDGISRLETLTNNPAPLVAGPPSPAAPIQNPIFAGRLLWEAGQAHNKTFTLNVPVLVLAAGSEEDWYVNADGVIAWAKEQQARGVALQIVQCPYAKHFLENEPYPIGPTVHQLTTSFLQQALVDGVILNTGLDLNSPEGEACVVVE